VVQQRYMTSARKLFAQISPNMKNGVTSFNDIVHVTTFKWYVVKAWCIFLSDEGQSFQTGKYMDFFLLNESQRRAIMAIALQVTASVRALARCHAQPRVCARGVCRCARVWCGRAL